MEEKNGGRGSGNKTMLREDAGGGTRAATTWQWGRPGVVAMEQDDAADLAAFASALALVSTSTSASASVRALPSHDGAAGAGGQDLWDMTSRARARVRARPRSRSRWERILRSEQ
ncbi:hypothetical protein E4U53_000059 [Claviceps sorghi]|nr:hypothetical protein E4U53_000059 [Claviceps sorghi]